MPAPRISSSRAIKGNGQKAQKRREMRREAAGLPKVEDSKATKVLVLAKKRRGGKRN